MRIYEFTYDGDSTWIYAPGLKEAKEYFIDRFGDLWNNKIIEIPEEEWKEYFIVDLGETEPDSDEEYNEEDYLNGYKIIETFADYVKGETGSFLITTSF